MLQSCGNYGVYLAVTSLVPLFFAKIALRGIYGTDLWRCDHGSRLNQLQKIIFKDLHLPLVSLRHRDYGFSADSHNSFPRAMLLNANRAGSTGKRTWLGVQGSSEATVQMFKLCACPLDLLNPHSEPSRNEVEWRWTANPHAADFLIMNVSL